MAQLGLPFQFIEAVDGKSLGAQAHEEFGVARFGLEQRFLSRGELACCLSHRQALLNLLYSDAPYGVIMEDDVSLPADFARWISDPAIFPEGWELVRLSGSYHLPYRGWPVAQVHERMAYVSDRAPFGSACYLVSRDGAAKLLRSSRTFREPIDLLYGRQLKTGCQVHEILPYPVGWMDMETSIGDRSQPARRGMSPLDRLGRKLWRARISLERRLWLLRRIGLRAALRIDRGTRVPLWEKGPAG